MFLIPLRRQASFKLFDTKQSLVIRSWSRSLHIDGRNRASQLWAPTGGIDESVETSDIAQSLLVKGGFLRQAHSGVFHLLPLGLRVQTRLETLIDKHMSSLGASKVSLSSLSTSQLWQRSGRLGKNGELLKVLDRKDTGFLLSPTHEEEITALVSSIVQSYKDLPLRLYQISRKYRDEMRPRQGLLRAKEFLMKDLYTFDSTEEQALETYRDVVKAYNAFFEELKLPYLVAHADSGDMGGDLSHEFHFVAPNGEDEIFCCSDCNYVANEEVARTKCDDLGNSSTKLKHIPGNDGSAYWFGHNEDISELFCFIYPESGRLRQPDKNNRKEKTKLDLRLMKNLAPEMSPKSYPAGKKLDTVAKSENLQKINCYVDYRVRATDWREQLAESLRVHSLDLDIEVVAGDHDQLNLLTVQDGDSCPNCNNGILDTKRAIEVGHTFHLGTRYSEPLDAKVTLPETTSTAQTQVAVQMGCHGIGVSRLMGAIAGICNDSKGLKWPRSIAPFKAVIIYKPEFKEDAEALYDQMSKPEADCATLLDDRSESFGWRLRDADLIGYPTRIVLGRSYEKSKLLEVHDRLTGESVEMLVDSLLAQHLPSLT